MLRLTTRNLFTTSKSFNQNKKLISISTLTHLNPLSMQSTTGLITKKNFFSTINKNESHDNFLVSLKEKLLQDHSHIENQELKQEINLLHKKVLEELNKDPINQPDFVKVSHARIKNEVKDNHIITIPIGNNFSDKAIVYLAEQLEKHGYAIAVSWASFYFDIVQSDKTLSFCKALPGVTDSSELARTQLSGEETARIFSRGK